MQTASPRAQLHAQRVLERYGHLNGHNPFDTVSSVSELFEGAGLPHVLHSHGGGKGGHPSLSASGDRRGSVMSIVRDTRSNSTPFPSRNTGQLSISTTPRAGRDGDHADHTEWITGPVHGNENDEHEDDNDAALHTNTAPPEMEAGTEAVGQSSHLAPDSSAEGTDGALSAGEVDSGVDVDGDDAAAAHVAKKEEEDVEDVEKYRAAEADDAHSDAAGESYDDDDEPPHGADDFTRQASDADAAEEAAPEAAASDASSGAVYDGDASDSHPCEMRHSGDGAAAAGDDGFSFEEDYQSRVPGESPYHADAAPLYVTPGARHDDDDGERAATPQTIYNSDGESVCRVALDADGNAVAVTLDEDGNAVYGDPDDPELPAQVVRELFQQRAETRRLSDERERMRARLQELEERAAAAAEAEAEATGGADGQPRNTDSPFLVSLPEEEESAAAASTGNDPATDDGVEAAEERGRRQVVAEQEEAFIAIIDEANEHFEDVVGDLRVSVVSFARGGGDVVFDGDDGPDGQHHGGRALVPAEHAELVIQQEMEIEDLREALASADEKIALLEETNTALRLQLVLEKANRGK